MLTAKDIRGVCALPPTPCKEGGDHWSSANSVDLDETARMVEKLVRKSEHELWRLLHKTTKKVGQDIDSLAMNTAISTMMIWVNAATGASTLPKEAVLVFLRLLAPWAPHLCEELWQRLDETGLISTAPWPSYDEALVEDQTMTLVIQVNGKKRDTLEVQKGTDRQVLEGLALESEKVQKFVAGQEIRKIVVVPDRLVNIVV